MSVAEKTERTPPPPPAENLYPIQPTFIVVREIQLISHRPPSKDEPVQDSTTEIGSSTSDYDPRRKCIQISLTATLGSKNPEENKLPYYLRVSIIGEFQIKPEFPQDKISVWAQKNGPFVLYPYLREKVHHLSGQASYHPVMMPLIMVPIFKAKPAVSGEAG